jgi:hypothetical protein
MDLGYPYHLIRLIDKMVLEKQVHWATKYLLTGESKYFEQNYITNPILRVMNEIAVISPDGSVKFAPQKGLASSDWIIFRFLMGLLTTLDPNIQSNPDYQKELVEAVIGPRQGDFYPKFYELLVGGYLKYLGFDIQFNSSRQTGQPDVITTGQLEIANDIKLFPDPQFWLTDVISKSRENILDFLRVIPEQEVLVLVLKMDRQFIRDFKTLGQEYLSTGKPQRSSTTVILRNTIYAGNQGYLIDYQPNHARLRIIPNFDMADTITQLNKKLASAEQQFRNSLLPGIVWIGFPNASEGSIERRLVWEVEGLQISFAKNNLAMALCEFVALPDLHNPPGQVASAFDIHTYSDKLELFTRGNFEEYIKTVATKQLIFVP